MNVKNTLMGLALLVIVCGAGYYSYRKFILPNQPCDLCGRAVHAEHDSVVRLRDGSSVHTCCPRCALHYELQWPERVARLTVSDRATGKKIDGRTAMYVEGSDDHSCLQVSDAPPREPGIKYDRTFDRCLPSLVAFKDVQAAREFAAAQGGKVVTYAQAVASVKQR